MGINLTVSAYWHVLKTRDLRPKRSIDQHYNSDHDWKKFLAFKINTRHRSIQFFFVDPSTWKNPSKKEVMNTFHAYFSARVSLIGDLQNLQNCWSYNKIDLFWFYCSYRVTGIIIIVMYTVAFNFSPRGIKQDV